MASYLGATLEICGLGSCVIIIIMLRGLGLLPVGLDRFGEKFALTRIKFYFINIFGTNSIGLNSINETKEKMSHVLVITYLLL